MQTQNVDDFFTSSLDGLDESAPRALRMVQARSPALTGREMARQVQGEFTRDRAGAVRALVRPVEATYLPPVDFSADELEALRDDAARAGRVLERASIDVRTRAELVRMINELTQAERIRERTESAIDELTSSGPVRPSDVTPTLLRSAAETFIDAREDVLEATRALDETKKNGEQRRALQRKGRQEIGRG